MKRHILALDQGTTSSRAILFESTGKVVSIAQREFKQHYPKDGWVEHDPLEIWDTQLAVAKEVLHNSQLDLKSVSAIGITNQRETTVLWDRTTGKPIHPAIVWQDRRTAGICTELKSSSGGMEEMVQKKTGLLLDPYFSGTKISWILENIEGARSLANSGKLAFGTIDSWLIWNLTGGRSHVTDVTNASRTMLLNLQTLSWDPEMLALFKIPESILPSIVESSGVCAKTEKSLLGLEIPIAGIAGDQQAALFGQLCTEKGKVKNTYGTGCFALLNCGSEPVYSKNRLLTTVACKIGGQAQYALEGSVFMGGAVVQWLRDELKIIGSSREIEALAQKVPDAGGMVIVPAFTGLGAPYWNPQARGMILGLTRGSNQAHFARAALESIALQSMDVIKAMEMDAGFPLKELNIDGGAASNNTLMQLQADLIGVKVVRPTVTEVTALGAAYLAGLAVGIWSGVEELIKHRQIDKEFHPQAADSTNELKIRWKRAVDTVQFWSRSAK